MLLAFIGLVLLCISGNASAAIVDDVILRTDANGETDAIIKFTVPIQYVRHFPEHKSQFLSIYFNILDQASRDQWQNYESHRSPPSDLIVGFTVTTRDLSTGPRIDIQFNRPAEFSVTPGRDNQTLLLHLKPERPGARMPAPLPPRASPAPRATLKVLPALSGAKSGLPNFPEIEQFPANEKQPQSMVGLTLAERVREVERQAAAAMTKARQGLLAGQMVPAIDALSEVLDLPANRYSPDAQIWIGIARERIGQPAKAKLEYESYLRLYPDGAAAAWAGQRLARLNSVLPPPSSAAAPAAAPGNRHSDFQTAEYGSLSMYYYHGSSHTDTIATVGTVSVPSSLTVTDQSSLIGNLTLTARSYNDRFDNRFVLQDFYAANFLPGQSNKNRLNAAYLEVRNREDDYSARIGRQSALGGGVLGRFDGITAGYGFTPDWRANVVAGQLAEAAPGHKPRFYGASVDFGLNEPLGGSLYAIHQKVGNITDRQAVGGNLRYFEQQSMVLALLDYDLQFKALNMFTLQGTLSGKSGTDYNFLLDRRKTPSLSLSSAVNGTTALVDTLLQNGWTKDDLIALARRRTAMSSLAQFGITSHFNDKWQAGTDIVVSSTSSMPASGTLNPDFTTGLEGFVPATPATGNAWTLSERISGNDVFSGHDISMCSLSYTRSRMLTGKTLLLNNRTYIRERITIDGTLRLYWQTDNVGGRQDSIAPVIKLGYRPKDSLTLEVEWGLDRTRATPSTLQPSTTTRTYSSLGFRWDF